MTDYRAELQRLLGAVENDVIDTNDGLRFQAAVDHAHATLAQPEPQGPTDEEIEREALKNADSDDEYRAFKSGAFFVQERISRPAIKPVPVAERLPEPEDCDGDGFCWFWNLQWERWMAGWQDDECTYWLPHHALPVPGAEGCQAGTHPV
jgi:hypothetical protein